jgi:Kef-type K+ transport system membrane component KefB
LFYPVLLEALFNLNGSEEKEIASTVLKSGLLIFFLILNYLLFEWRKNKLHARYFDYLKWSYFATISCYALVFLFFAFTANGNIESVNQFTAFLYGFTLVGSMYIPVVSVGLLIVDSFISGFTKLVDKK